MGKFRFRRLAVNLSGTAISFVITYLLIEFFFFRFYLPYLPLNVVTHLPGLASVLVQNSKAKFVPEDYVALLGDSYAVGVGDWLLQANGDRTKSYHSAHVIHARTGRDVVSFAGGTSSAEAIVLGPAQILSSAECYFFPKSIEAPKEIFIYYYEGNDVNDNLRVLDEVKLRYGDTNNAAIDRYLREQYAAFPFRKCHSYLGESAGHMAKFLFQHYVQRFTFDAVPPPKNKLLIAGEHVHTPSLQGPALGLSVGEIVDSMRILDRSLLWLRQQFPDVPRTVIYLPSAASLYHFADDTMYWSMSYRPGGTEVPLALVKDHRNLMCGLVSKAAVDHGAAFLDAGPALRTLAAS